MLDALRNLVPSYRQFAVAEMTAQSSSQEQRRGVSTDNESIPETRRRQEVVCGRSLRAISRGRLQASGADDPEPLKKTISKDG